VRGVKPFAPDTKVTIMAIRDEFDEYAWITTRESRIKKHPKDLDQIRPGPAMKETVVELVSTLCGIGGVFLLIFACLRVLGYSN
jgi:hypothetical protein